jgi:hypothetical protein
LITVLSGPYAGRTREMPDDAEPNEIFGGFICHGWGWRVDYFRATDDEILKWFRVELAVRIIRALERGLPVRFLDREWRLLPDDNLLEIGQQVEDAIVASGRLVTIVFDDEKGLVVGAVGYEQ